MANDMYDAVRKTPQPKRRRLDKRLWLAIVLALAVLAVSGAPALRAILQRHEFQQFTTHLTFNSTMARRKGSVSLEMDGETFPLDTVNYYDNFIRRIINAGPGRSVPDPDEPPAAALAYSTGAVLELWPMEVDGTTGTFFRYTNWDGKIYSYESPVLSPQIMVGLLEKSIAEEGE